MNKKSDEQLYQEIKQEVKKIITFDEFNAANELIGVIEKLVKNKNYAENNVELYNEYRKLLIQLKWIALPLLKQGEILGLFGGHFQRVFSMEYFDLQDKFKQALLGIIMHEDRDKFKSKVKHILDRNKAKITTKRFSNNKLPTVENWIKNYTSEVGTGIIEALKLHQYFTQNKEFNNLSRDEKEKLKNFFEFYERLKLSSLTAAGIEETIPVNTPEFKGQIRDGRIEKEDKRLDVKTKRITELAKQAIKGIEDFDEMAEHYKTGSLERKAIEEEKQTEKKIKDLRELADSFAEGSLERKAVEEEIGRLKI